MLSRPKGRPHIENSEEGASHAVFQLANNKNVRERARGRARGEISLRAYKQFMEWGML